MMRFAFEELADDVSLHSGLAEQMKQVTDPIADSHAQLTHDS